MDRVAKMIPMELNMTIDKALAVNGELRTLIEDDEQVAHLIEIGKRLEGSAPACIHPRGGRGHQQAPGDGVCAPCRRTMRR